MNPNPMQGEEDAREAVAGPASWARRTGTGGAFGGYPMGKRLIEIADALDALAAKDATLAAQAERIAVLEAALRALHEVACEFETTETGPLSQALNRAGRLVPAPPPVQP